MIDLLLIIFTTVMIYICFKNKYNPVQNDLFNYYKLQITDKYNMILKKYMQKHIKNAREVLAEQIYKMWEEKLGKTDPTEIKNIIISILEKCPNITIEYFDQILTDILVKCKSNEFFLGISDMLKDHIKNINNQLYETNTDESAIQKLKLPKVDNIDSYLENLLELDDSE